MNTALKWALGLLIVGFILAIIGEVWLWWMRSQLDQSALVGQAGIAAILLMIGMVLILCGIIALGYGAYYP